MPVTGQVMTANELLLLPDDGYRYELVDGRVRRMTPAGFEHGAIVARVTGPLEQFVRVHGLGIVVGAETGFKIGSHPDTVRAPDVAFVGGERVPATGLPAAYWPGPPDLAVEVLSPGDTSREVQEKIAAWLTAGTRAVWIVDPQTLTITVHRPDRAPRTLSEQDPLEGEDVVPGFQLAIASIFTV